jgi:transposase
MNVKLQQVVSDITGVTGMAIIRAIVRGERDPEQLAQRRDCRCKQDQQTIAEALRGHWREEHLFELRQALELYDTYQSKLQECDVRIEQHLATFEDRSEGRQLAQRPSRPRQGQNAPRFNLHQYLLNMTGVDLTAIDGIDAYTVLKVISEIGLDMSRWATVKHFASWLGLCPGSKISGGKRLSSKSQPSANRAAAALRMAAQSLYRSQSALGAFHRCMRMRLGKPQAITATAHKLARIIYSMLRNGTEYVDPGPHEYDKRRRKRALANLKRKAKAMGFTLVEAQELQPTEAQPSPAGV